MRLILALVSLVAGVVTGAAALVLHQYWWGLALGIVTALVALRALRPQWWGRLPFALGWVGVAGYGALTRPEGDYLVPANLLGYAYLATSVALLVVVGLTLPVRPRRRVDPGERPRAT